MRFLVFPSRSDGRHGLLVEQDGLRRGFYSAEAGAWVIVDGQMAPTVGGLPMHPFLYNGEPAWHGAAGAVFKSASNVWIFNPSGFREPYAEKDLDGETWIGDGWWLLSDRPSKSNPAPTATPRGTLLNGEAPQPPDVTWAWPRWEKTAGVPIESLAGIYRSFDRNDGGPGRIDVSAPKGGIRAWVAEVALWR